MSRIGCRKLYVKTLAENDNSKNQIYLGPNFESLNLIPNQGVVADTKDSKSKFKAQVNFAWLDEDGNLYPAPKAKLILYPQYPEVRFSGFLQGCQKAPSEFMQPRTLVQPSIPDRILFLGIRDDGIVVGYLILASDIAAEQFRNIKEQLNDVGVFKDASSLLSGGTTDSRHILLARLREISGKGWLEAKRLQKSGLITVCRGQNCGGYTLEAELGILPNSASEPDFMGWEIKQHGIKSFENLSMKLLKDGNAITLMTPEPSAGHYRERGVLSFLKRYGYPDKRGRADRINFSGVHKVGLKNRTTELTLALVGYDHETGKILEASGGIALLSPTGEEAARWSFADLMAHWNRKHALAAYVPSMKEDSPVLMYRYGPVVRLGEGTDFLRFLKAAAAGLVYYDPGIKVENLSTKPKEKRRNQFRVKSKNIQSLYESLHFETLV